MNHRLQNAYHSILFSVEEPGDVGHQRLVVSGSPAYGLPVEPPPRRHGHGYRPQGEQVSGARQGGCPLRKPVAEPCPAGVELSRAPTAFLSMSMSEC